MSVINYGMNNSDNWLTPPELLRVLGPFDMDVCCPTPMPWKTAPIMLSLIEDGLVTPWKGRIWCNPPYSDIIPWVKKMALHGDGIMLLPAKSSDTKWGQMALGTATAVYFMAGRLLFHFQDGQKSTGKWSPYMLLAYGEHNVAAIISIRNIYPGLLFRRSIS